MTTTPATPGLFGDALTLGSFAPHQVSDYAQLIRRLKTLIAKRRLPDPDYTTSHMFAPQWKQVGCIRYYQLPATVGGRRGSGQVVAMVCDAFGQQRFYFCADGMPKPTPAVADQYSRWAKAAAVQQGVIAAQQAPASDAELPEHCLPPAQPAKPPSVRRIALEGGPAGLRVSDWQAWVNGIAATHGQDARIVPDAGYNNIMFEVHVTE